MAFSSSNRSLGFRFGLGAVVLPVVIAGCGSTDAVTPTDLESSESDSRGVGPLVRGHGKFELIGVAVAAIEMAGEKADYRNCVTHGCDALDGLCYEPCEPGYEFVNPFVSRCFKKGTTESYDRGRGKMYCYQGMPVDPPEKYRRNCEENGCDYTGGLCYRRCPEGWVVSATEPTSCTKPCPAWYNDTGGTCYKGTAPVHSIVKLPRSDWFRPRGAGRISCENGEPR